MINIIASGNKGAHISLLASLLNLEHRLICPVCTWDSEYENAYGYALDKLKTELGELQETVFWKWYVENKIVYESYMPADYDIFVDSSSTMEETVLNFLKRLHELDIIRGLHLWLTTSVNNRAAIKKTWEVVVGHPPDNDTLEHWNERTGRVLKYRIDFFSWMLIVRFCREAKRVRAHSEFYNIFKDLKWSLPVKYPFMAIVLSGHARNYFRGTRECIDYIYTDVFIHTWSTLERRMTPKYVDANDLQQDWVPVSYQIEELTDELKRGFRLSGPMLFSMHQHDADPSVWENADLYSMNKAAQLVRDYEVLKGKQYAGVCRLPFVYNLTEFKLVNIFEKITRDIFWMPPGGCTACNREYKRSPEKAHDEHINKLYAYWMFGKRDIIMLALDLYVAAERASNEENYLHCPKHKQFRDTIYVYGKEFTRQHHTGVSMSLFNKPNLLRIQMQDYLCVGCDDILGEFPRFELDLHADGW